MVIPERVRVMADKGIAEKFRPIAYRVIG